MKKFLLTLMVVLGGFFAMGPLSAPGTGGGSGTPGGSSGDLQTNSSGSFGGLTPASGITNFLGTATSANLATALSDENGSGKALFAAGTIAITSGKTVTFDHSSTFTTIDSQTYTFPTTSATLARTDASNTFTGDQTFTGSIITGSGGSAAGVLKLGQGTAPSTGTTNISLAAPASVTSYIRLLPGAVGSTGYVKETVSGSTQTESVVTTIPAADIAAGTLANDFSTNTQTPGNNSTKLATTAYADTAITNSKSATQTLTNKWVQARVGSTTSSATPTINTDNYDVYKLTAQAADITSMTTNLSGTPVDGDQLELRITGTAARAITWGTGFVAGPAALPTTTTTTKTLYVYFEYDSVVTHWVCMYSGSLP